jgi:hypothetical protein
MQNRKFSTSDPAFRCSPNEENLAKVDRVIRIPSTPFAIAYSPSNRSPLRTKRQTTRHWRFFHHNSKEVLIHSKTASAFGPTGSHAPIPSGTAHEPDHGFRL